MTTHSSMPGHDIQAIIFERGVLRLLDQRLLPARTDWLTLDRSDEVARAIADLVVRGAPAIGIAAAYGAVIAAAQDGDDPEAWERRLEQLEQARPTAVNLAWALARMRRAAKRHGSPDPTMLEAEARGIHAEDVAANQAMAAAGSACIDAGSGVLTHCNTGALATGGIGTALGVVAAAYRAGKIRRIFAGETRPWLQGARLTAWELARMDMPFKVVIEGAAAALMASGQVQWVITGADRIAANGDVANKIGTCSLAVIARHYGVRVMVVAPSSTVDPDTPSGQDIAIEQRDPGEIWRAAGLDHTPPGFDAWNPVFDITPATLVDCIVTEAGVHHPPYRFAARDSIIGTP
ncbi:S-methyl-5-thioribose-1-phosphate isomerase [Wenzhouxiangella sp. AB-CW3]|uniref:S-methyl-5-thioribose-1-phosphate isomerase n=1 Tax=Wenzhouxiangella sp. AB-CW3 TaxID=2771012 RepID=UPI00168C07BB|nr:S-methyl-5-thioribose-1-phosphate isomerase [Wenzhouxiangella sp. AB-CW3]QOC21169.1 S-methyl-5-thioribose-1-phosphate isomerase [Wenzhouxiangella sp. AB-CW3]